MTSSIFVPTMRNSPPTNAAVGGAGAADSSRRVSNASMQAGRQ
jgi:hypothetical protein